MRAQEGGRFHLLVYLNRDSLFGVFSAAVCFWFVVSHTHTESEQLPLNRLEMKSSFFQVYSSCLTNLSTPFNTQLIETFFIHCASVSDPAVTTRCGSYESVIQKRSNPSPTDGGSAIDATSGSFGSKCDKQDLTETVNLLSK